MYVAIISRSPWVVVLVDPDILHVVSAYPNRPLVRLHPSSIGNALGILPVGFHGLPFHGGRCGMEEDINVGVPILGSCVPTRKSCQSTKLTQFVGIQTVGLHVETSGL